jgi:hypothetical protein
MVVVVHSIRENKDQSSVRKMALSCNTPYIFEIEKILASIHLAEWFIGGRCTA